MPLDRDTLPVTSYSHGPAAGLLTCSDFPVKKRSILRGIRPLQARTTQQAVGDWLVITRTIRKDAKSGFTLYGGVFLGTGQVVDPENASYVPVQCQNNQNLSVKLFHDLQISVSLSIAYLILKTSAQAL
jgi:hypothetical protein